jgi:hypothetical protein
MLLICPEFQISFSLPKRMLSESAWCQNKLLSFGRVSGNTSLAGRGEAPGVAISVGQSGEYVFAGRLAKFSTTTD